MPAEVTEPLTQMLSWALWLASGYCIVRLIMLAPTVAHEWRHGRRGKTSENFFWWCIGAILLSSVGTVADVLLS